MCCTWLVFGFSSFVVCFIADFASDEPMDSKLSLEQPDPWADELGNDTYSERAL